MPGRIPEADLLELSDSLEKESPSLANCFNSGLCNWLCQHRRAPSASCLAHASRLQLLCKALLLPGIMQDVRLSWPVDMQHACLCRTLPEKVEHPEVETGNPRTPKQTGQWIVQEYIQK